VFEAALQHSPKDRAPLAKRFLMEDGVLKAAQGRYGYIVAKTFIDFGCACVTKFFKDNAAVLQETIYGRRLVAHIAEREAFQ